MAIFQGQLQFCSGSISIGFRIYTINQSANSIMIIIVIVVTVVIGILVILSLAVII